MVGIFFKSIHMEELINRLKQKGLTQQQAMDAITVIKDYAKEKFPVFAGAIENMFTKYAPKEDDDFLP
jgi:hypothetical protein